MHARGLAGLETGWTYARQTVLTLRVAVDWNLEYRAPSFSSHPPPWEERLQFYGEYTQFFYNFSWCVSPVHCTRTRRIRFTLCFHCFKIIAGATVSVSASNQDTRQLCTRTQRPPTRLLLLGAFRFFCEYVGLREPIASHSRSPRYN